MSKVYEYLGREMFFRGRTYPFSNVEFINEGKKGKTRIFSFEVEDKYKYRIHNVKIETENNQITDTYCDCSISHDIPCDHIAASLVFYYDEIFSLTKEELKYILSQKILEDFALPDKTGLGKIKKQLNLTVELEFDYPNDLASLKLKIGEDKMYSLNNKLSPFIDSYRNRNGALEFGKNFTYDPSTHFFSKEDEDIIKFAIRLLEQYRSGYYRCFSNRDLIMDSSQLENFLQLLHGKEFTIGKDVIREIKYENPIELEVAKESENYTLNIKENYEIKPLVSSYNFIKKSHTFYVLLENQATILSAIKVNDLNGLIFEEKDMDRFTKGLLPIFKNTVTVDDELKDKIIIGITPDTKIYLDLKGYLILCNLKFDYKGKEIDYFDEVNEIVRDSSYENEVVGCLLGLGFEIEDKKIFMSDLDNIGVFLEEKLEIIAAKYEVFTSNKIKDTRIVKENHIRSSFSIGKDNIMSYSFDLGGISNDEIVDILDTMQKKKKYYRLKSGDFLNLEESEDLKELESLVDELDLKSSDLKRGTGEIPKYRAIYLDSIKKDKYHIVETNNMFDELINNFNSYKDCKVELSKEDKTILRDYQQMGIKWLYNIYKCGFGGILADEMGLGKSVQLIYLIKAILKEKKNAKILIVSPTSLVYNWVNEFNKFGSELKYKEFAENRNVRHEELNHLDDVNILITTYGLLRRDKDFYKDIDFELVAIDEAQNIKNVHAQMTQVVKEIHGATKIALTGTPLENSVLELWSIFDFIMPGYLTNIVTFNKKYNLKDVKEEELTSLDNLNKQIRPFILRRKKKDVIKELPDKIENNIYIDLNPEQKKLYVAQLEKTQKELDEILKTEGFKKGNFKILQLLTKLRQLCIDPKIVYDNYNGGSAKIENILSLVKDIIRNGHKILVFTSFKTALDILNREFTNNNISTYIIEGSVSSKRRMELVDKFNNDDTNVFLITLKSGGTGLNLTSADVVIHLDLWWNPQVENQATDRAHRIGQKNTVEVIKLITRGTIEEKILELQNKKKILSDKLIDSSDIDQNIISKLSEEDVKNLLSLDNSE